MKLLHILLTALSTSAVLAQSSGSGSVIPETPVDNKPVVLTKADEAKARESGQTYKFETEVHRMMKLIINSLYKTKEIFLRELISNGSDALDKIRFQSLTNKEALLKNPDLKLSIYADKEARTLTITDTGIGMTKNDLKTNLGVIAKSGTSEFLKSVEGNSSADMGLIGQFGVGFYSVFLVADSVVVVSKHNDDKQYIWESTSEQDFIISEDPRGDTLGRGTQIIIHLKSDATEYLEESKLKGLVLKYSEFINFPIFLWTSKTVTEEVPDLDAEMTAENSDDEEKEDQDESVEDVVEDTTEKKPKTKTVSKTVQEWEKMNDLKAIWSRSPKEVAVEDYNTFYQTFAKESTDPMAYSHFHAEGEMDFKSILFVPARAPASFLQKAEALSNNIKLFVRKVFITDELKDFLPRYLGFLRGLIDSDDLPLNVSRETLQQSSMLKLMRKKLIGKALEMFKNLAKDEEKWAKFIKEYNTALKLGVVEDTSNRKKLSKLIRFPSSHGDGMYGLEEYVQRMKKGQPQIYVCTGSELDEVKRSPFTEKLIGRGYEVLYLADPIDEYVVQSLTDFAGKKIQSIGKAGLKYGDEDDEDKTDEALSEKFKPLNEYLLTTLSSTVEKVVLSNKLTKSPCAIVAAEHGITGTMEKLMQAQALGGDDFMRKHYMNQKKILEINPAHPIMEGLLARVISGDDEDVTKQTVKVLYETTLLTSGYAVPNTMNFAKRIEKVIRHFIGVDLEKEAVVDVKPAPEVADAFKESADEDETEDEDAIKVKEDGIEEDEDAIKGKVDDIEEAEGHDEL